MNAIKDFLGREFKTLRVSLTNSCNLACNYCVEENPTTEIHTIGEKTEIPLDAHELIECITAIHKTNPLETIRLTGGEPLLFKKIDYLLAELVAQQVKNIKLTTNGVLLDQFAERLAQAGVKKINVSLDAIDPGVFFRVTRRKNITKVFKGIDAALEAGIEVKINMVVMKGVNDGQILPMMNYAREKDCIIRFLELMQMGHMNHQYDEYFFSEKEMLQTIGKNHFKIEREKSATANYWLTEEGQTFGIISNTSTPFCHDCNRLRLDSFGNIFGCLSNPKGFNVHQAIHNPQEMESLLVQALDQKQATHFTGSKLSMQHIGG
ncbi:MAG: GTP 3',8-cyclase MoaA [Cyclobacteriaceae bacterium]